MNLLELRNRIRDKAIDNGLTYTEIETLFDVNLLLEQTMPCLLWRYSGETNNFDEVGTEMSLNVYLITTFPDSVRVETEAYQRDYIVTQQNALRTYFYTWLQAMPFESGDDYLEILSTEEIPIAERLGINEFLTVDFRVNISIKRDFCVDPEQVTPSPSQVQVYFNDVLRYTQACNVNLELILKNQDGDLINDATFTGYEIVVTQGGADARVSNSDDSYDVNVASGGDLELPDENITLNGGAFITKPSVKNQNIELVDTGDSPITPDSVVGNKIVVDTSAGCVAKGAIPLPTGANVSYATGDDGDLKRGRLVDYNTLLYNNGFGTTDRFTDELGGQIYTNNIIIDWSTWDGGTDVLGFIFTPRSDSHNTRKSWSDWMSGQPFTTNGFGNWYVVNPNEVLHLYDITTANGLTNSPINIPTTSTGIFWTSYSPSGGSAWYSNRNTKFFRSTTISQPYNSMFVRTFNWNGASLT